MFGVELRLKDGIFEHIDPVEDEPLEKDGVLYIDNGYHTYEYEVTEIVSWSKYDLCDICGHDVSTYDCNEECMNDTTD